MMIPSLRAANRFMRLGEDDRWLILETSFYLLYARLATVTISTRTLLAMGKLDPASSPAPLRTETLPLEIAPAIRALDKSCRRFTFANCLTRAIALRLMLAHRDIETELHIGARKDEDGQFAAHAWLTYDGTILVGGNDATDLYRELVGSTHALLQ
jgi:hypothetical protein